MRYIISEVYAQGGSVVISGHVWDDGNNLGARDMALSAIDVMLIVEDEGLSDPQKKAAIRALVVEQVQNWRMVEAYSAAAAVRDLAPSMPITLTFDLAPLPEE
jgi:hypothetical protein